jgi:UDP-N-acetyl-D-galactosamine dehydrogenase
MNLINKLESGEASICVVGLGYVGLPLALEFAKKFSVVGYDFKADRVEMMKRSQDPSQEIDSSEFKNRKITFTADINDAKDCTVYIVAVPTPINSANEPNLGPLLASSEAVGKILKKGDYVIYESTTYPGCTEDDCVPVLSEHSSLEAYIDFKVGYSPERINPGDKERPLTKILKIVSGNDEEATENVAALYDSIITAGVFRATNIKVAEAAKIIENTQRDVNISLMNELSVIFNKVGINTYDVIEAAGTKWNFHKYTPGLVGGHCIGVDPYYLVHKAEKLGLHPRVIAAGRFTNDNMAKHIAAIAVKKLNAKGKVAQDSRILIMGATFKENVADIRNSKIVDVVNELKSYSVNVSVVDAHASSEELEAEYGFGLESEIGNQYDGIILAVSHQEYLDLGPEYFKTIISEGGYLMDIKGVFRNNQEALGLEYWSL